MKKTLLLMISLFFIANILFAQAVDTIIAWTFPDTATTTISWEGLASNHGKYQVFAYNQDETVARTIELKNGVLSSPDQSAQALEWDNGSADKCWYIKFIAENYENLKLSAKITSGGNKPGPAHFKTQYKIGSSGTWTDIAGADITTANDWTTGVLDRFALPAELSNPSNAVHIRFIMKDNMDPAGANVLSSGVSKIDDIYVTGNLISTTGIRDFETRNPICYPNPSEGPIQFDVNKNIKSIAVYSVIGELIYKNDRISNNQINLSDIKRGMYIVQLTNIMNVSHTEKLILK